MVETLVEAPPPVDQSVNRPGSGIHSGGGDLHRMMNEVRLVSHSQCSAQSRRKLYCDPWIWKWDCKAESDSLSSGSWRGHTCHDELDVACRDMCCDIMPLVPQQHFFSPPAMPQDASALWLRSVLSDKFSIHTYYTVAWDPICPSDIVRQVVSGIDLKREILRQAGNKLLFT